MGKIRKEIGEFRTKALAATQMETVSLQHMMPPYSEEELQCLAEVLASTQAQGVILDCNNFGPEGAKYIADGLAKTRAQTVFLFGNKFGPEGAKDIADGLAKTRTQIVKLNSSNFGPEGAKAIVDAILKSNNQHLEEVSGLDSLSKTDESALKELLERNKKLNKARSIEWSKIAVGIITERAVLKRDHEGKVLEEDQGGSSKHAEASLKRSILDEPLSMIGKFLGFERPRRVGKEAAAKKLEINGAAGAMAAGAAAAMSATVAAATDKAYLESVEKGNWEGLQVALKTGVDLNAVNAEGKNALEIILTRRDPSDPRRFLILKRDREMMGLLLERGINLNHIYGDQTRTTRELIMQSVDRRDLKDVLEEYDKKRGASSNSRTP